jgi:Stress responsive A/B Barrel Domain
MTISNKFVHHVFFWLNNVESSEDRAALIEGLKVLSVVPTIAAHHIATPAGTSRGVIDSSYAVSWLCLFDSAEAEEVYQSHPIHLKFIADCSHLWSKVIVYDSVPEGGV